MSDARVARILKKQKEHEERMRQRDLEKNPPKKKEEKTPTFQAAPVCGQDPIHGMQQQASGASGYLIETKVAEKRWTRVNGEWRIASTGMVDLSSSNLSSTQVNCYKTPITAHVIPQDIYTALNLKEPLQNGGQDRLTAIKLLREAVVRFYLHSGLSTCVRIWKDIKLSIQILRSNEHDYIPFECLQENKRMLLALGDILEQKVEMEKGFYKKYEEQTKERKIALQFIEEQLQERIKEHKVSSLVPHQIILPDEVLLNIFSFLPKVRDILELGLVCKAWKRFAEEDSLFYRHYCIVSKLTPCYDYDRCYKLDYITLIKEKHNRQSGLTLCLACEKIYWETQLNAQRQIYYKRMCPHSVRKVVQADFLFDFLISQSKSY